MTEETIKRSLKESFDKISPDEGKKEELYNAILMKMEEKSLTSENSQLFTDKLLSFFKASAPYIAVCACLIFVAAIGFGGGFNYLLSATEKATEAAMFQTADNVNSVAASAEESHEYSLETCEEENPETAKEDAEEETITDNEVKSENETASESGQTLYSFQSNGNVLTYSCQYDEYDPLFIWTELQKLNSDLKAIELLSYKFDELNHIIILDFSEEIEDLINSSKTYNHIVYIGEVYRSFYPDYRFSVKVNSELLMKDGKQVDFKSHNYIIIVEN